MNGGDAEVLLYEPAAPAGTLKALNPSGASYTPGSTRSVDSHGLEYTNGTCADVYRHSGMATSSGPVPRPGVDFPFAGYPISYPPYTVSRARVYTTTEWGTTLGCDGCHGYPPRASYPTNVAGAGESHSYIDEHGYEDLHGWNHGRDPLGCRVCHLDTVTAATGFTHDAMGVATLAATPIARFDRHVNGQFDVRFDTTDPLPYTSSISLTTATWDPATRTCSDVQCHRQQSAVAFGTPYRYESSYECNVCHQL